MESLIDKFGDKLAEHGLSGIVIFGLTVAVIVLFRLNTQLHEAREKEIRAIVEALNNSTATYKELVSVLRQKVGI